MTPFGTYESSKSQHCPNKVDLATRPRLSSNSVKSILGRKELGSSRSSRSDLLSLASHQTWPGIRIFRVLDQLNTSYLQ